jgi:glycosyltransferase involved in cell wall biosynthesis
MDYRGAGVGVYRQIFAGGAVKSDGLTVVAPVLPPDVVATAQILAQAGMLRLLVTRSVLNPLASRLLRGCGLRSLADRPAAPVARDRVSASIWADLVDYSYRWRGHSSTRATDRSFAVVDRSARRFLTAASLAVFAREDCCRLTFARARELGVTTVYQLPTGYWRVVKDLMGREIAEFPGVCRAAAARDDYGDDRGGRKDEELALSDNVLAPSTFVQNSLRSYPGKQKTVQAIPFGGTPRPPSGRIAEARPVFLYVGNVTMRKGVHRLLLAWRELRAYKTHELRLVGDMYLRESFLSGFRGMYTHVPRVPRFELENHYSAASLLVFNAVADGFGNVLTEAMARGLPIIASRNSGAPDLVEDGREGRLVDYGDNEQLMGALDNALSNPSGFQLMGELGRAKALSWTWDHYGKRFMSWLAGVLPRTEPVGEA